MEFIELVREYKDNKNLIDSLTSINEDLRTQIITCMGDKDCVVDHDVKVTYRDVQQKRVDTSALKKAYPDIVDKYTKVNTYKRFTVQ